MKQKLPRKLKKRCKKDCWYRICHDPNYKSLFDFLKELDKNVK